jgi:hypothetical protein
MRRKSAAFILETSEVLLLVQLPAGQSSVIVFNGPTVVIVFKCGISPSAILFLAAGDQCVAVSMDVLAGFNIGTARSAVIATVALTPTEAGSVAVTTASVVAAASVATTTVVPRALKASIQVLYLAAAAIIVTQFRTLPSIISVLAICIQG